MTGAAGGVAPLAFTLSTPKLGDPTTSTTPTLTWQAATGASSYDVEIATKSTFGADDVVTKTGIAATSFTPTDALAPGVIYYWRATAVNAVGRTPASNAPFSFSSPVGVGPSPHGVAVTPDGSLAVVSNDASPGSVQYVDLATFKRQATVVSGHPGMVAVSADGKYALVAEGSPNDVVVFDIKQQSVAGKVTPPCVATTLYGLAVTPDGTVLVPDVNGGCTKDVLDLAAIPGGAISRTIDLGSSAGAFGIGASTSGKTAMVTRGILGTSVLQIDFGPNGTATQVISGTSSSFGAAFTPDGKEVLVSSGENDTIKRISLTTSKVTGTIPFDSNQDVGNIAVTPDGKHAVVVSDFTVGVLSLADGTVATTYALAGRSVAVTPDSGRALVTGAGTGGKLYVIKLP